VGRSKLSMKLHLDRPQGRNQFTGYGAGFVSVNATRYEHSLIVTPERIIDWRIERFEQLTQEALQPLASLEIDILVLGTGGMLRFPPPSALQPLQQAGIGVEVMDSQAACRTYNILLAEDRRIAAAIVLPPNSSA
jgi:uncharacterized protein